ncbi:MAG: HAD family phosphatase [Actinomycetota bacterium]|nr:HAD family phosphatase [Actinomycetota bacterium]
MSRHPHGSPDGGLQAVLWDLDGTLIDSEPAWMAAEFALAARHGASWSEEQALALLGSDLLAAALRIRDHMCLPMTPQEIVDHLLGDVITAVRDSVPWRPGARRLLLDQHAAGIPAALVTMSYRSLAQVVLDALPTGLFAAVVVGDEVSPGKPHPEPYLRAARLLGVDPERCVGIEDSPAGVLAAESAGCHVLVVPHRVSVPVTPRRTVVPSLGAVDVSALRRLACGLVTK